MIKKKALILDLDNTIYSVESIGNELFSSLFELIENSSEYAGDLHSLKKDIMRKPFQDVAADYQFSEQLTKQGTELLRDLKYEGKIAPFSDYVELKAYPLDKYLVTRGFLKLQESKIKGMKLEQDFKEIHIIDPDTSDKTKKDVFEDIIERNKYKISEVLVIGDDPHSEIKAAFALKIDAVLYDKFNIYTDTGSLSNISDFRELKHLIG